MNRLQDSVAFFFPFVFFVDFASFAVYQTQSTFLFSVPVLAIPVSSCLIMRPAFANQQIIMPVFVFFTNMFSSYIF